MSVERCRGSGHDKLQNMCGIVSGRVRLSYTANNTVAGTRNPVPTDIDGRNPLPSGLAMSARACACAVGTTNGAGDAFGTRSGARPW